MKSNRTPRGKRILIASLAIVFGSIAAYSSKEFIIGTDGKLSAKLGPAFNKVLLSASKLGMGLGELHTGEKATAAAAPEGMVSVTPELKADDLRPASLIREGEDPSLIAKGSKQLHKASRDAFISASKVEIYAK